MVKKPSALAHKHYSLHFYCSLRTRKEHDQISSCYVRPANRITKPKSPMVEAHLPKKFDMEGSLLTARLICLDLKTPVYCSFLFTRHLWL